VNLQRSSQSQFQLLWGRAFRVALRFVFGAWIVLGAIGAVMSIFEPIGVLVGGFLAALGFLGWRATRRPFHEWGIVASLFPGNRAVDTVDPPVGPASRSGGSAADNTPPRPNKSLERTPEG
jgi:hypothetical protein